MILPILILGDKRLRQKSEAVNREEIDKEFRQLVDNMFETMYDSNGVGLAAVQIGVLKRFMVMDAVYPSAENPEPKSEPRVILNPTIIASEGSIEWEEGCLSCPELIVPTQRKQKIEVKYHDLDFNEHTINAEDFLAVVFQHEMDHMNGKLIVDKLSKLKRERYVKLLKSGEIQSKQSFDPSKIVR